MDLVPGEVEIRIIEVPREINVAPPVLVLLVVLVVAAMPELLVDLAEVVVVETSLGTARMLRSDLDAEDVAAPEDMVSLCGEKEVRARSEPEARLDAGGPDVNTLVVELSTEFELCELHEP